MKISRRHLLGMLGLGAAGMLMPSLGGRSVARASGGDIPKRIIFFYTEQGTVRNLWPPNAPGAPAASAITTPWSTTDHTLGSLHQPLVPFQRRLLFLDGIDMVSATVDPIGPDNGHINGETHALVANNRQSSSLAGGMSIDQFIASSINKPSPLTMLPSLELFVDNWGGSAGAETHPLYSGSGQPLPLSGQVGAAYDRLFPNGPRATSPEEIAKLAHAVAQQRKILDFNKSEYAAIGSKLGKAGRDRLDAHAAAVGDFSNRLGLGANVACRQPDRSILAGTGANQYESNADVMLRLAQTALACDLTRVVTVYMTEPPDDVIGFHPVGVASNLHGLVHEVCGGSGSPPTLSNDPEALRLITNFHSFNATQYAKLLTLLDSIPEADGGTLLDHTVVVWCGQLASGDHSLDRLPIILGGGMGGTLSPGRYVRYPRKARADGGEEGPAHNDLFVALANRMGVATNTFGNAAVCKGALGGLS